MNVDAIENATDDDLKALGLNTMGDLLALRHFCQYPEATQPRPKNVKNTGGHGSKWSMDNRQNKRKEKQCI